MSKAKSTIRDPHLIGQVCDYAGLKFGNCGPTDIDLSIDFKGEVFIFAEFKWGYAPLPLGQRIHLEHLVKGLRSAGKMAYACHVRHHTPKGDVIMAAEGEIVQVYYGVEDGWERKAEGEVTLHEFIEKKHTIWQELRG